MATVGIFEFLARSADTPRFDLALVTIQPHRDGPPPHSHAAEDDLFSMLEGELTFIVEGKRSSPGRERSCSCPPQVETWSANRGDTIARFVNVHAPAGFDLRMEADRVN